MARHGFIHTKEDIKFLILYSMGLLEQAMDFNTIVDLCTACDEGFGWFELKEAFDELVESGHVQAQQAEAQMLYDVSTKGSEAVKVFSNRVPYSVRDIAQKEAARIVRQLRRDAVITTQTEATPAGNYAVTLCLEDAFTLQLFASTATQATKLEANFRKNAELVYAQMLAALQVE